MEATIHERKPRDHSLERVLRDTGVQLRIERDPTPLVPEQQFWVFGEIKGRPIRVAPRDYKSGDRFDDLMPQHGEGADIAVRAFITAISRCLYKENPEDIGYKIFPAITWDGILRVAIRRHKKK